MGRTGAIVAAALLCVSCARDPQDRARRYVESGDRYARDGRNEAALIEYRNALREWPEWREAHFKMGAALDRLGRTAEAYRAFAAGRRIVDGRPLPHDEAALRAVVDANPESAPARLALAEELLLRDEAAEAETHLEAAAAIDPENELASRSLAALYLAAGRKEDAERLLRQAAGGETRYRSKLALADFLIEERRYAEARGVLDEARAREPLAGEAALRLAAIDYAEGRVDAARRAVSDLVAADPTAEAWTLQADFHYREGRLPEALAAAREALALDPELPAAHRLVDAVRRQQLWR